MFQLKAIRHKYDILEERLMDHMQKTKIKLADFMEENVLANWTGLRNQRLTIEARLKHSHEVACFYLDGFC